MDEADFTLTERRAILDSGLEARRAFAQRTLDWALGNGHQEVHWHFASREMVKRIAPGRELGVTLSRLERAGEVLDSGVRVVLSTKRMRNDDEAPLAVWLLRDERILALDSTRRPLLDVLVSKTSGAPIWLTAFGLNGGGDEDISPVEVSAEVQETVSSYSGSMTLSNGAHDSCAPPLIAAARQLVRQGRATPSAVGVAALRAGWWPNRVPDLVAMVER